MKSKSSRSLFEFDDFHRSYPISLGSFKIPGLGDKGRLCNHKRLDKFSKRGEAAHFKLMKCKRIECPSCWLDWARRTTFDLALKVEAYARAHNERPFALIMSVPPQDADKKWDWERVNTSLFQRGYRRGGDKGVAGGSAVFHPYRLNAYARGLYHRSKKGRHKARGHGDIAIWNWVRLRVKAGENLLKFVKLGPHVHGMGFGDPQPHSCKDYVIKFEGGYLHPTKLELKNVVGYLFYQLTHTGVITHKKSYKRHRSRRYREFHPNDKERVVRKALTHTIREFGELFRVDSKELLGEVGFNALASEIATMLGMEWDAERGELGYPAFRKELGISDKDIEWVPIYELGKYLNNEAWLSSLTCPQQRFWLKVYSDMRIYKHPPEILEIKPPPDIAIYVEREGLVELSHDELEDYSPTNSTHGFHPEAHSEVKPMPVAVPVCFMCRVPKEVEWVHLLLCREPDWGVPPVEEFHGAPLCAECFERVG